MHRSPHPLVPTIVGIAALTTALVLAGCAAGTAVTSETSGASGHRTSWAHGSSDRVAGVTVTSADGYAADSAPIAEKTHLPEVANLEAGLRRAVTQATAAAASDGVEVRINSGWRSARYQQALLDEAVKEHGSLTEARRWVNTPERSAHVRGQAVDVGEIDAAVWMQDHGSAFGLCQTYQNESWHYELATTPGGTCPRMRHDSSEG